MIQHIVIEALNSLPVTGDSDVWTLALRKVLMTLFPDVDRIAVNINMYCDPIRPPAPCEDEISVRFSSNGSKEGLSVQTLASHDAITKEFESETGKFVALEKFHAPKYFHYFHESGQYLGSLIFFRAITASPTSPETFEQMDALAPFIRYVYASFLAMRHSAIPFAAAFRDAQSRMESAAGFTMQERKVMTLKLAGYSYKLIASHLDISLNTVRTHVKSIHRKTNTQSYTELFAKYFTPVAGDHL